MSGSAMLTDRSAPVIIAYHLSYHPTYNIFRVLTQGNECQRCMCYIPARTSWRSKYNQLEQEDGNKGRKKIEECLVSCKFQRTKNTVATSVRNYDHGPTRNPAVKFCKSIIHNVIQITRIDRGLSTGDRRFSSMRCETVRIGCGIVDC